MTVEETAATEEAPKSEAKGMRAQIENLSAENRRLKADKRDEIVQGLGLETDTGLGMALVEQFDKGDLGLDDIATAATEKYGHVVPDAQPPSHPEAPAIAQGQDALDQVGQTAGSIAPPTETDVLAQAEAEGDYDTAMAIKGQEVNSWFSRGPNRN